MMRLRTSSVVAFSEMARLGAGDSLASSSMPLTRPTVETVIRRGENPAPQGCSSSWKARVTLARLCSGSPMPMKTMLVGRRPATAVACATCSTISPADRWREKPRVAVAQNWQSSAQPTCDEIHSVSMSRSSLLSGISTDSMARPSKVRKRNLRVPSCACWCSSMLNGRSGASASSRSTQILGHVGLVAQGSRQPGGRVQLGPVQPAKQLLGPVGGRLERLHPRAQLVRGQANADRGRRARSGAQAWGERGGAKPAQYTRRDLRCPGGGVRGASRAASSI